jgi:hypothetical protein
LSSAVSDSSRKNCWNTTPTRYARSPARWRSVSDSSRWLSRTTDPLVGWSSPDIRLSSVDLPDPDAPQIATISPVSTAIDTPRTDSTGGSPG